MVQQNNESKRYIVFSQSRSIFGRSVTGYLMGDRRTGQRLVTLKTGKIEIPDSVSTLDCAIFNISARGALILVLHPGAVTEYFKMTIEQTGTAYTCRRVWSEGHKMGVLFGAGEASEPAESDLPPIARAVESELF
jgi:hypothetical protein